MPIFKKKDLTISTAAVNDILDQDMIITDVGYDALVDQVLEAVKKVAPFELTEEPEHQVVQHQLQTLQTNAGASQYVTIIPVNGPLIRKSTWLTSYLGLSSYAGIALALQTALKDPKSIGILFDIDSPGGQSSGLFDLVDLIYSSRETKTIIGLANASAYSAAYGIGSATEELYVVRDGGVGSIGVIMRHFDYSEMLKKEGIGVTSIFAGKRKDDFSPYKPLSKEALKVAQDMVDKTYQQFTEVVSRNMDINVAAVKATEAGIFSGEDAVKKKLAKGVLSYEDAVNRTAERAGDIGSSEESEGSSRNEVRRPEYSGFEGINWHLVKDSFESYRDGYYEMNPGMKSKVIPSRVEDAPLAMKEWIASKSLLGDPKGNSWREINYLPVVNPWTNMLNGEALINIFEDSKLLESVKDVAKELFKKEFPKWKQDSLLQKVLNKLFKKGDNEDMDKAKMIELLIRDEKYPFGKDDQSALEGMNETMLQWLIDTNKDQIDEGELRAEIEKELKVEGDVTITTLTDQITTMKTTIETLTKEVNDTKIMAQNETDERMKMEFTQFIKDKNIPGDIEKLVKTMLSLSKGDEDVFNIYKESLEAAGASLSAAGVFNEIGSESGADSGESAYLKLQGLKVEAMKKDVNLSETQAWKAVVRGNAQLYREYMADSKRKEVK